MDKVNKLIVVIPAYEPTEDFIEYSVKVSKGANTLVVINDGSGAEYDYIFDEIEKIENATCLKHEKNLGKGCALKTAFNYCAQHFNGDYIIVTADCDGQHAVEDVFKVYEATKENIDCLILGSRDFTLSNIPRNSQLGNALFRKAYKFFYGLAVYDTQTGLRGCSVDLAKEFTVVKGKRFEYEMSVLIYAKKNAIKIIEVPIKTIYPENPQEHATHYKPIKDTVKIFLVVLKNLFVPKKRIKK